MMGSLVVLRKVLNVSLSTFQRVRPPRMIVKAFSLVMVKIVIHRVFYWPPSR